MTLTRFHTAQRDNHAGFSSALRELQCGAKTGHWVWYIFPQLRGLGTSPLSQRYAITDFNEALEYLRDPQLRSNYLAALAAVLHQLRRGLSVRELMGNDLDAKKLASSITLFSRVAGALVVEHVDRWPDRSFRSV